MGTVSEGSHYFFADSSLRRKPFFFLQTAVLERSKRSQTVSAEAKYDGQSQHEAKVGGLVYTLWYIYSTLSIQSKQFKANRNTFRRSISIIFSTPFLSGVNSYIGICSPRSKFLSLRVVLFLEGINRPENHTRTNNKTCLGTG